MIKKKQEFCLNVFERVETDWNRAQLSNSVGSTVLVKKRKSSEFGGISGFVGTVGTVGTEKGVLEIFRHKNQDTRLGR